MIQAKINSIIHVGENNLGHHHHHHHHNQRPICIIPIRLFFFVIVNNKIMPVAQACPRLEQLGGLASWGRVEKEELEMMQMEVKARNLNLTLQ